MKITFTCNLNGVKLREQLDARHMVFLSKCPSYLCICALQFNRMYSTYLTNWLQVSYLIRFWWCTSHIFKSKTFSSFFQPHVEYSYRYFSCEIVICNDKRFFSIDNCNIMRTVLGPIWLLLFNFIYALSFSSSTITFLVGPYILESDNTQMLLYTFSVKYNKEYNKVAVKQRRSRGFYGYETYWI